MSGRTRRRTSSHEPGAIQALLLALSAGLLFGSCGSAQALDALNFEGPIDVASITIERGDVRLVRADPGQEGIVVRRAVQGWRGVVELSAAREGGALSVDGGCRWALTCRTDVEIALPPGTSISVEVGEGSVQFVALEGPIDVQIGDGRLTGQALASPSLRAAVASGDISLTTVAPAAMDIASAAGDVWLAMPAGGYALSVSAAGGAVALDGVVDDPAATRVGVTAARGDVTIVAAEVPGVVATR